MSTKPLLDSRYVPIVFSFFILALSIACSSNNPDATTGTTLQKSQGRLLVASDTHDQLQVIDLSQSMIESKIHTFSKSPSLIASPSGSYALIAQSSGNKVDLMKMGASVSIVESTSTTPSTTDSHAGHAHKSSIDSRKISRLEKTDTTESVSSSSVEQLDFNLTGDNLMTVISKGDWLSVQFNNKVTLISEDDLSSNLKSINTSHVYNHTSIFPGIPLDEEHLALGTKVVEIKEVGTTVHEGSNISGNNLSSSNIISATRATEGLGLYGTDIGILMVKKHIESGNTAWEDFIVNYPSVLESQIFLAEDHHDKTEAHGSEHEDEHDEVSKNKRALLWATHDALSHAFVHIGYENHSAGIYLFEAKDLEPDSASNPWTLLEDTSSNSVRPIKMTIGKVHNEISKTDSYLLLILMSNGNLRICDASDEGKFLRVISNVITPITDFHVGEGNFPGLATGNNKAFIGDPKTNAITQIDLNSFTVELSWSVSSKPNHILYLGESSKVSHSISAHSHD